MEWSGKRLAVMLYPNITRNFAESWQSFDYVGDVEDWGLAAKASNRLLGPVAMFLANGKIKKKYNIVNEREELDEVLKEWMDAVAITDEQGPFLHGASVSMADLAVFGVLRAIHGLDTFAYAMENQGLHKWYAQMEKAVETKP
jgi:microsomal prostaglandin-E synthase 2